MGDLAGVCEGDRERLKREKEPMSDSVIPWTAVHQAPLSMGFSRQEYWSGLPFPSPEDLPDLGNKSTSLVSLASAGDSSPLNYLRSPL